MIDQGRRLSASAAASRRGRGILCQPARKALLVAGAGAALLLGGTPARSGPCTAEILQVEQKVASLQATPPASGAGEPTAPQTLGAQLHHQPTPNSVAGAEHTANADADAALERARKADAAGDAAGCTTALTEAKHLYGID